MNNILSFKKGFLLLNRGYYMAAWGYEFYLLVLKVSLTSERCVSPSGHVMFCLFYRY